MSASWFFTEAAEPGSGSACMGWGGLCGLRAHLPWTGGGPPGLKRRGCLVPVGVWRGRCWAGLHPDPWRGRKGTMEGERGRASSLGSGARAGSVRAKVCVYTCLRVCAHAQTDTKLLAGVGSVAGLLCPLAQGSGGHCGDHVCPGPLHCPWGPGPRLPTCRPLEGVTGPALQVGDQSCLRQRRLGRAQHGTMGEGAGVGDAHGRGHRDGPHPQAQMTKLGEEMSLRFLKREARLCGFLQKSFLALEKRMKASESARLRAESALREELEGRWQQLQELDTERVRALQGQCQQEECHLLEQCRGLDKAVVQLTEFVQQNQVSLNRVLLAEQKAWDAKGQLEDSRAGELATYLQENLEAMQLASELAQQETHGALELLREKSQALEVSVAELVRQVKDLSDHFLALRWRLDLQEQTLSMRLQETQNEWAVTEQRWREGLTRCREEAEARLREVQEQVDQLPQQIEAVTDKCVLHKSDSDCKISAEATARELAVEAVRQELAALLSSVQLLREGNPGRKIAEIQGKLATFQNQMMKLETSIQDNKTIQNLKFNTETKLRAEAVATLQESVLRLWSEEGPWAPTLSSRRGPMSLGRQQLFVKDVAPNDVVPVNHWGVYQAVRWLQWKTALMNLAARQTPRSVALEKPLGQKPACRLSSLPVPQK
ncbi:coiled-coil domain-containing protein 154 isoform X3 [Ovis aries]|uniref:coiled-coil domain-containing protein 154 isoform X3 n=1 Tax=Ovis aries TaxID=9940 RepID=UPI00295266BD|nr:coiled-coil domain-containing protein 154 isoform X3 [Ovis aries]